MKKEKLVLPLAVLLIAVLGAWAFFSYQAYHLLWDSRQIFISSFSKTSSDFFYAKQEFQSLVGSLKTELSQTKAERDEFQIKYEEEKAKIDFLSSQIKGIEGTVGLLEKLSQTDKELLKKYSKVSFLNENYIPQTLTKIEPQYTYNSKNDYFVHTKVWPFLKEMLEAASQEGIEIQIISAYRSFGTQTQIKSAYTMIYGSGANAFSADQGYSEHQLGTTLDFTTPEIGASYFGFENSPAYQWLGSNAYKHGFILSYPEGNQYYQFEPWHWRFVGKELAGRLQQQGKNFYDLEQRDIDQYLVFIFD